MPGVTYERQVELTPHGPVAVHVLTAPRPGGLYGLAPALSNGAVAGRESLTALERRASATATVAGVNGDFFAASGEPSGIVLRSGVLDHPPDADRSSIGVAADGSLRVEPAVYNGRWRGAGRDDPLPPLHPHADVERRHRRDRRRAADRPGRQAGLPRRRELLAAAPRAAAAADGGGSARRRPHRPRRGRRRGGRLQR